MCQVAESISTWWESQNSQILNAGQEIVRLHVITYKSSSRFRDVHRLHCRILVTVESELLYQEVKRLGDIRS
jgi:hypothetical protein